MFQFQSLNSLIKKFHWKSIKWKGKQLYSKLRAFLGGGKYVYDLDKNTKFISRTEDEFSHVIFVCNGHEKKEMEWCCQWIKLDNNNQSVIDCGANIGYFSAVISQRCQLELEKIIAVEGNNNTAKLCKQNLQYLGINNAIVIETILVDEPSGVYDIPNIRGREPWQRTIKIHSSITNTNLSHSSVTTLDHLITELNITPSLIKIDCEGFETFILKGADSVLKKIRPTFMIECNEEALLSAGSSRNELLALLKSYNYKLFHLGSFSTYQPFGIEINDNFQSHNFNFAAIPNDECNLKRWENSLACLGN